MTVLIAMANFSGIRGFPPDYYAGIECSAWVADSTGSVDAITDPMRLMRVLTRYYSDLDRLRALIRLGHLLKLNVVPFDFGTTHALTSCCRRLRERSCIVSGDRSPQIFGSDFLLFCERAWEHGVEAILIYNGECCWELFNNRNLPNSQWSTRFARGTVHTTFVDMILRMYTIEAVQP